MSSKGEAMNLPIPNPKFSIVTTEMHTCGEPVRIIESGYPRLIGETLLQKRRYAKKSLDHLRKLLMLEPRGHADMYGALLVAPDNPEADLAVIFLQNEGYSPMCGHATIALSRYAVDKGLVTSVTPPETTVNIQCPCGLVRTFVQHDLDGKPSTVRFHSVPAFAFALGISLNFPEFGDVTLDIGYGGAFYAILPAENLKLNLATTPLSKLLKAATAISDGVKKSVTLRHPDSEDLAFLYGTILTDGKDDFSDEPSSNICFFADEQVDRSPTGSGVTARIALQVARESIQMNQVRRFRSITGMEMKGRAIKKTKCGEFAAVIVEVEGKAYYTGQSRFILEDTDPLPNGFRLK